ncbi:DUF4347 domain-containing protein [Lyngbya sp. PCC 8106]|uniref:DUF4347 domain-containing protein n=1 Tax=Lyngbya sp. (strain PCC 8106) TaxID=313612 RepID=UPI0000EA9B0A|nr:DUF4347 domain-containing protein [Lyngbya sp. PCC 8106]EAW35793.1 hypothetical protein L8106_02422 [Lyngbya sp. PCC 8106]
MKVTTLDTATYTNLKQSNSQYSKSTPNSQHFVSPQILVVFASNLFEISTLIRGVNREANVLQLDPNQDAIEQITSILKSNTFTIQSLHLVTHASANILSFGNTNLSLENVDHYRTLLEQWNVPEILLYGCNLAQENTHLIQRLHQLTGANIAASSTPVGCLKQGGNWDLDVKIGHINSEIAFNEKVQNHYPGLFIIERVSVNSQEEQAAADPQNLGSQDGNISNNGQLIAFESNANNLVPDDNNDVSDIFVRDRQTGITTRVSINSFGQEGNDKSGAFSDSILPAITPDGRFVAFESKASNLAPGDNNAEEWDIFVRDLQTETTTRVSIDNNGISGDDASRNPVITPDGRFIAFESRAENLVPRDNNSETWDIFVHDRDFDRNGSFEEGSSRTVRISINGMGLQGNDDSFDPSISNDGRFVLFESDANNLVVGDNNGVRDIFIHDRDPDGNGIFDQGNSIISRLPIGLGGVEANNASFDPQFSGNNRFIVFESLANNLVEGDSNNALDIFVYDLQTGVTNRVSVDANGVGGNQNSSQPSISNDGRFVGFSSRSSNFVLGDNNGVEDIFVHDRDPDQDGVFDQGNGIITRVSISDTGEEGNANSFQSVVSGDGSLVSFESLANNLIPVDTNGVADVFISTIEPAITILPGIDPIEDGETNGVFEIRLNQPAPPEGLTVNFSIAGDAINPDDYRFAAGNNITNLTINSLTIAPGATTATLDVIPVFDNISETDETIEVSLQPGTNYALTTLNTASLIIGDRSLIVTNTNDTGVGSLRQVINLANQVEGTDIITFEIPPEDPGFNPNTGTFSIQPLSPLPTISDAAILDATSQPGYIDRPLIEIDGSNVNNTSGLTITAGNSTVKGFVINRFSEGIRLITAGNNTIQGNYIGTDISGNIDFGNIVDGIFLGDATSGNLIGGTTPQTRNLISGNGRNGVQIDTTSGNIIQGNYIGTNISGTADLGNSGAGIGIFRDGNNQVGGTVSGAGNLISGNDTNGIELNGVEAINNLIQGNFIGTTSDGNTPLGNTQNGILIFNDANNNTIGGVVGSGNIIGFNNQDGVRIDSGEGNAILSNSIFDNGLSLADIGIDLNNDGISENDFGDGDTGANTFQNYPDLLTATLEAESITINGIVDSTPGSTFTVQFFANETLGESDRQGRTFLGETQATSNIPFTVSFNTELAENQRSITATATDANNNTSEFSAPITANTAPVLDLDEDDSSGITGNNYSNRFTEGREAVAVADTDVEIEDADSPNLAFATLTLTNPINGIAESLAINGLLPTGITATAYNSTTGELQLRGEASIADYQTAISQVVYNNTQLNPDLSDRLINITVNDGTSNSNIAETTLSLVGTVQVSIAANLSPVEGEIGTFTITLDEPVNQPLIIEFDPDESIAIDTEDYTLEAGTGITTVTPNTFTIEPGVTTASLNVVTVDDNIFDPEETVELTLIAGSNYLITENNSAFISIVDNDIAGVLLTPPISPITTEDGETTTFELVLSSQPIADVIINLENTNLDEGNLSDNTITFTSENWDTPQVVTVSGVDDNIVDGDTNYSIIPTVSSLDENYNNFELENITLINQDNDVLGILLTPPLEPITTEDGDSIDFDFVLVSEPTADVIIDLENTNPDEGNLSAETLTFTSDNWDTPQVVTVSGVDDNIVDGDVDYSIITTVNSEDINYNNFQLEDITLTNQDNDEVGIVVTPPIELITTEDGDSVDFDFVLSSQPIADITINFNSNNPNEGIISTEALSFTAENWNIPQTVTVTGVDDSVVDGDVEYIVSSTVSSQDANYNGFQLEDITLTNQDNDVVGITLIPPIEPITTEEGDSVNFEFVLNSQPTADVIIELENLNSDEGIISAEILTFTPENWNNSQIVTVTGVDDDIVDGDVEYRINTTVVSNDLTYDDFDLADINLTNLDNDEGGIFVTPIDGLTTTEAGDIATFEIVLTSEPTADVRLDLNSSNPNEGSISISEVIFTPENWDVSQIVIVTGVDDDIADGDLSYSIITDTTVSNDPIYNGINPADVSLVNADNETPGITVTPVNGLVTSEAEGSDSFEIFLNTEPVDDVTIGISSSNITEGIVSTEAVTFTPENWNIPQMITVTGVDDNIDDDDIAYSIITTPDLTTTDPNYNEFNPPDINVINTDNETAEIVITPTIGLTTSEVGGIATFDVFLTSEPLAEVTFNLASSNTTEGTLSTETLSFTPQNWELPQTVTITGVDDLIADGNINYSIITGDAVSLDAKYNGFNPDDIAVINTDNETPGITVSPTTGLETSEAGETATFQVVLNTQPVDNVTLNLISDNPAEGSIFPPSLIFTPENWLTPQIVTVTGVDDFNVDGEIEYRIITEAAISNDLNYNNLNPEDVTLINLDNDLPVVDLSVDLTTGEEANTTAITVTVTASANVEGEQTVNLDISGIGITSNDYTLSNPQMIIPDGNNTATVTFQVLDDVVFEGDETATLTLLNPSEGIVLGTGSVNLTIIDNDTPATVEFSQTDYQINEDGTSVGSEIIINRTGDTSQASTVEVQLTSETATAGEDFDNFDNNLISVRFAANQKTATVNIPIFEDNLVEEDETFSLALVNPSVGTEIGTQETTTVEIFDNEIPRIDISQTELSVTESGITDSYNLVLTTVPSEPVTIRFQTDSQIEPITEVTFDESNWNVPQTIEVQAIDDELVEDRTHNSLITHVVTSDDQNYNGFILDDINIEIAENDVVDVSIAPRNLTVSEDGETDTYSLVLTREPELPVTIEFELNEQQLNSIDAISFDSTNWNIPQTVTVEAIDDLIPEGDETLAISHTIVSEDENYRDLQIRTANVEILDNDVDAEVIIVNNTRNLTLTEGETTASYEIVLSSPPVLPVTIEFNTGNRINSIPSIEFNETNWNIPQTVNLVAINDNILQGNSTEIISHTVMSADRNYDGLEISDLNIDIADNDVAEVLITQTSNRTEVSEDGLTDTYQVVLNSQPTEDVVVTITPDSQVDLGEGGENEIELIFTSENWNEPQTVTVEAVDDEDVEADIHTSTINHAVSSNDSNYNSQTPIRIDGRIDNNITVDIIENDEPLPPGEPGISVIQPVRRTDVIEGFGSDVYKIVLNSEPTANVEININPNSQLETDKQTLNFTPSNWKVPQTITVTAVDDNLTEGSEVGTISHTVNSDDSRYDSLDIDQISANISDNDNTGQQNNFSEAAVVSLSELDDTGVGSDFDDILFGNQGNDRISGEEGFDLIYGQGDADALSGEVGDDVLFGGQGDDQIQGDAGNDIIYGDRGSDRLWGGEGEDQLLGGFGNDRLIGGLGADTLTGDLGNDAFVIGFGTGGNTIETADVIVDFTDTQDVIELVSPLTFEQLNITSNSNVTVIQVQSTGEFLAVLQGVNPSQLSEQDFV